jgi:glucose/arabinose dehydrogenase
MRTKNILFSLIILMSVCTISCANDGSEHVANNSTDTDSTHLPPVETKSPNSDYKPAFSGQTRIAGVKTTTPYKVEKIADKLGAPFAIVTMPDGRLMVTLKDGYAEIHDADGKLVKKNYRLS